MVQTGTPAPDFTLPADDGSEVSLSRGMRKESLRRWPWRTIPKR